ASDRGGHDRGAERALRSLQLQRGLGPLVLQAQFLQHARGAGGREDSQAWPAQPAVVKAQGSDLASAAVEELELFPGGAGCAAVFASVRAAGRVSGWAGGV